MLVTSHDALGYFGQDYGFKILAIDGLSTKDSPTSKRVADLIQTIKTERVKAIFAENISNPKVQRQIEKETGAKLAGTLYADGLGKGDADTYIGMWRHNVSTIVGALK
ncbi:zinc ABC transporter substrate-binding protein [Kamptonema cortianum]|nr:zinc ABC transporter substrate-binding protein [Kamptonema cortianum]